MAREYLYKAKRKDNGEWVGGNLFGKETIVPRYQELYVLGVSSAKTLDLSNPKNNILCFDVIPETVSQYTGLQDKFGTKIFEGDIVRYNNGFRVITWSAIEGSYMCVEEGGEYWAWISEFYMPSIEVIGNKFDNPELLEVQDERL